MRHLLLMPAILLMGCSAARQLESPSGIALTGNEKVRLTLFDGVVVGGYVDLGGYLNFTGPNINLSHGRSKLIVGMLPSLRFKEDSGETRNAFVTPALGTGITYCYGPWSVQVPLYYNAKTATQDGRWNVGIGAGLRIDGFKRKN